MLSLPLAEVSAKVRTGPPLDDEEDYQLRVWAGVIPLRLLAEPPVADPRLPAEIDVPGYASEYKKGGVRQRRIYFPLFIWHLSILGVTIVGKER